MSGTTAVGILIKNNKIVCVSTWLDMSVYLYCHMSAHVNSCVMQLLWLLCSLRFDSVCNLTLFDKCVSVISYLQNFNLTDWISFMKLFHSFGDYVLFKQLCGQYLWNLKSIWWQKILFSFFSFAPVWFSKKWQLHKLVYNNFPALVNKLLLLEYCF